MRRLVLVLLFALAACKKRPETPATVEGPAEISGALRFGDAATAGQLIAGFHEVEQGAWRWTTHEFSVNLRPPFEGSTKGALLTLKFNLPEAVLSKTGPVSLVARAGGAELVRQTYSQPGPQTYLAEIPAAALSGPSVRIDFSTDKFLAAGVADKRELALIVSSVALEAR
jgi:hypothetical protein